MSNMTPFEIRLELLKMAQSMLEHDYFAKRERTHNDWQVKVENARHSGMIPPEHPDFPSYPSESEIITKATTLNGFVSQTHMIDKDKSKK